MYVRAKKTMRFFFSHETHTKESVIVFGGSQVRRKLKNYYNWFGNSEIDSEFVPYFFLLMRKGFTCKYFFFCM